MSQNNTLEKYPVLEGYQLAMMGNESFQMTKS